MKKIYKKPGMEVIDLRIQEHLLETSVGDFETNKTGSGENASGGGNPLPGGGSRSPEFFGDGSVEED